MANIALIVKSIKGNGGIQKNYHLWFNMFKQKGHNIYLFVLENDNKIKDERIIFLKGYTLFQKALYLNNLLKQIGNIDLFLINAEYMRKYINKKFLKNYYITIHNTWEIKNRKGLKKIFFMRRMYSKYKNQPLIGISQSVINNIVNNLKIPIKKGIVIYAPHDFKLIQNLASKPISEKDFIVAVGGLQPRKRYDVLINAFNLIKNKISSNLLIIGEGKEKENLIKLIVKLNLTNRVKLLGFKENPYSYIKNAKLLALSSESEGLPRVVVESLILKTPVVATNSSEGIFEIMKDELKHFVVEKNNVERFAFKMLEALQSYPEIKETYYEKFNIENCYKKFMELI